MSVVGESPTDESVQARSSFEQLPHFVPLTLDRLVTTRIASHESGLAVVCGDHSITYADVARRALALHGYLDDVLPQGSNVGVCLGNRLECYEIALGLAASDHRLIPLDARWGVKEIGRLVGAAQCACVIAETPLA